MNKKKLSRAIREVGESQKNRKTIKAALTSEEVEQIMDYIDKDGFEYAILDYTDYKDIKDKTFHTLRTQYAKAKEKLEKYLEKSK